MVKKINIEEETPFRQLKKSPNQIHSIHCLFSLSWTRLTSQAQSIINKNQDENRWGFLNWIRISYKNELGDNPKFQLQISHGLSFSFYLKPKQQLMKEKSWNIEGKKLNASFGLIWSVWDEEEDGK